VSPRRTASEQLLDQLMEAARRDEALHGPPRRARRRRRALGLLAAVLLGGAAAAGAAELISTGEPVRDRSASSPRYEPPAGRGPELVTKAPDSAGGAAWGVAVYTSGSGEDCALAGQVRGVELGVIRAGRFHPYARGTTGTCADLSRVRVMHDRLTITGAAPRTVVFGRTSKPERTVVVDVDGRTYSARPARGGAFVFVFDGKLATNEGIPRVGPARP
jgi:hypothetical protein